MLKKEGWLGSCRIAGIVIIMIILLPSVISAEDDPVQKRSIFGANIDNDGDLVPDSFELWAGTSPKNPESAPLTEFILICASPFILAAIIFAAIHINLFLKKRSSINKTKKLSDNPLQQSAREQDQRAQPKTYPLNIHMRPVSHNHYAEIEHKISSESSPKIIKIKKQEMKDSIKRVLGIPENKVSDKKDEKKDDTEENMIQKKKIYTEKDLSYIRIGDNDEKTIYDPETGLSLHESVHNKIMDKLREKDVVIKKLSLLKKNNNHHD